MLLLKRNDKKRKKYELQLPVIKRTILKLCDEQLNMNILIYFFSFILHSILSMLLLTLIEVKS